MRRMNVKALMTSWLVIGGSALVLLAVLHCFEPLPHPWLAAIGTSAASLVIASGQEWGRMRIARRARRSSDATR